MRPQANVMQHAGTIQSQDIRMSLDANVTHIMSVLTDLYSDKELAVIREYSTNALDSHRCAGIDDPIEVELPTDLRPMFTVRDHGVGMSVDDITNNFSKYGWSSKRETDNEVGLLGLGCKSGLTYTNQFSLTAVKEGVKTTVLVTKDNDGTGVLKVLDTAATDEPNGVEIQIPIARPSWFSEKARKFFRFWDAGTVSIDGEICESIFDGADNFLILDPDVVVTKGNLDGHYFVMGNVPYPLPSRFDEILGYHHKVVARVPIGTIDFTPSRESLHMTARTEDAIRTLKQFVKDKVVKHVHEQVASAPTHFEALRLALNWHGVSKWLSPEYDGEKVPNTLKMSGQEWSLGGRDRRAGRIKYMSADKLIQPTTLVVTDHPQRSMDKRTKDVLIANYQHIRFVYVVHCIDPDLLKWISGVPQVSYETIKPGRLGRQSNGVRVDQTKWLVRRHDSYQFEEISPVSFLDETCYVLRSDQNNPTYCGSQYRSLKRDEFRKQVGDFLRRVAPTTTFVVISTSDVERFKKLNPKAKHFLDYVQILVDRLENQLNDHELAWGTNTHPLGRVEAIEIYDPDTAHLAARVKTCMSDRVRNVNRNREQLLGYTHLFNKKPPTPRPVRSDIEGKLADWSGKYPLLDGYRSLDQNAIDYMNALFQYRTQP